jgi:hypothetical protein
MNPERIKLLIMAAMVAAEELIRWLGNRHRQKTQDNSKDKEKQNDS